MPRPSFPAVQDLIRQAERAAAAEPDRVRLVAELVRLIGERGADPYLLIGALVEGAVHTLAAYSDAKWPVIPIHSGHQFRRKLGH
jgi:hypothetical protein